MGSAIMPETQTPSNITKSLLNRAVYSVCCTGRENIEVFHDEMYVLRKSFFENGNKSVSLSRPTESMGVKGKIHGKIRRHSLSYRKTVGGQNIEEVYLVRGSFVDVARNLNGDIFKKTYYNKDLVWLKTEYFPTGDYTTADLMYKPSETMDCIEEFVYNDNTKNYNSQLLFPAPYRYQTAEQNLLNAAHGDNILLVSTGGGEFSYSQETDAADRKSTLESLSSGNVLVTPFWEVKDGDVPDAAVLPKENSVEFRDLFTPAVEQPSVPDTEQNKDENNDHETITEADSESSSVNNDDADNKAPEENQGSEQAQPQEEPQEEPVSQQPDTSETVLSRELSESDEHYNYTGRMINGKREGRGRTDQINGLTAYDGEYRNGKKNGFGSLYYRNGGLSYVGAWKDGEKDGPGVSFRETDHAMHITNWTAGKPGEVTTLFDKDGNLEYSGKIIEGKKEGAGISCRLEDGSVFIGQWKDGQYLGKGTLFDSDGNLVYSGEWKDGKRNGTGTEFDKHGNIVYSGEWKDNEYFNGMLYRKIDPSEKD
jgi:hypothetical protein